MSNERTRRGVMFVLSSPSGAGKSTLTRLLLERISGVSLSISATTRPPRPGEVDGRDYLFVSKDAFEAQVRAGDFLEHAQVFENAYGTPRAPVEAALSGGQDVVFDVDWQGARALRESAGEDVASVFILPPSIPELRARLEKRAADPPEVIARRMAKAMDEIAHWDEYDYVLVNHDIEATYASLSSILLAERLKRTRQGGLAGFVGGLTGAS